MRDDLFYITPRIVKTDREQEITVKGKYPHSDLRIFQGDLVVDSVRADGLFTTDEVPGFTSGNGYDMGRPPYEDVKDVTLDEHGVLRFRYSFAGEGENTFRIRIGDRILHIFKIFSIREEYYNLRPFKGDMHLHCGFSCCCGDKSSLSPEYYAIHNRQVGLDFIGISDHKQYFASLKAVDFISQCSEDFVAYPSEEIHLPDLHTIHNLNFGGSKGLSYRLHKGLKEYDTIYAHYWDKVPAYKDPYLRHLATSYHVIADWVREAGGINVFCHPFWRPANRLFLPEVTRDYVMENHLYDCLELFGGGARNLDETNALYLELCAKTGQLIPAVANTDSHSLNELGKNNTVIFAEKNTLSSLRESLMANRNVAVTTIAGTFPRTSGGLLWVSYFHFLLENYYDLHDALCRKEADLLFKALATGEPDMQYDSYLLRPYHEKIDGTEEMKRLVFSPDKAAFAALHREMDELENEFWQKG